MHLFGRRDQSTCSHISDMIVPGSNQPISLSLFLYACQPNSFFPPIHIRIHTTNMDLNLAWRTHFDLFLVTGMT